METSAFSNTSLSVFHGNLLLQYLRNMKKIYSILAGILTISAVSFSFIGKPASATAPPNKADISNTSADTFATKDDHSVAASAISVNLYEGLGLNEKGLGLDALELAVKGYLHLQAQGTIENSDFLSIADFSQSSRKKRFYLIDMKNQKLIVNTYVSHGKNSGLDMANDFSNTPESEKSSLGFYVTKGTYTGKNGYSLKMSGLEEGFNNNAEQRAIVVHGAAYVNAGRVQSAFMGRSQGCPALPKDSYKQVISLIKDGSTFFVYYPDAKYLSTSDVLNT